MANISLMLKKLNLFGVVLLAIFTILIILCLPSSSSAAAPDNNIPPAVTPRGRVRCRSSRYKGCHLLWQRCPSTCPTTCMVDCATCKPVCGCNYPGAVCQDPRFVGGDGNIFHFHGRKDQDFCLVSDANLHINGHFIGKRSPTMTRDFTWVQSIGIIFNNHKLVIAAKTAAQWDDNIDHINISFDHKPISLPTHEGSMWQSRIGTLVSVSRTRNTNAVVAEVAGSFRVSAIVVPITKEESKVHGYNITDENCFAHLELGFKFHNLSDMVDGVLGQTYRKNYVSKAKIGAKMPVLGGAHKFISSNIFATDCLASRFGKNVLLK